MGLSALHSWFWELAQPCPLTGCWEWSGVLTSKGYPRAQGLIKRTLGIDLNYVHRYVHHVCHGPIPDGLVIDHMCENKSCVNPDHIVSTTNAANILRSDGAGAVNARRMACIHGHALLGDNVRTNKRGQRRCLECGRINFRKWYNARRAASALAAMLILMSARAQTFPLPKDTLDKWYAVKLTTEDVAKDYKVLYAVKRAEADTCASLVVSQAGTIAHQSMLLGRCEAEVEREGLDRDKWFRAAEGRKKAAPWLVLAGFVVGVVVGGR